MLSFKLDGLHFTKNEPFQLKTYIARKSVTYDYQFRVTNANIKRKESSYTDIKKNFLIMHLRSEMLII